MTRRGGVRTAGTLHTSWQARQHSDSCFTWCSSKLDLATQCVPTRRVLTTADCGSKGWLIVAQIIMLLFNLEALNPLWRCCRVGAGYGSEALQQLVLIVADGRFHEKAALQRAVREVRSLLSPRVLCFS